MGLSLKVIGKEGVVRLDRLLSASASLCADESPISLLQNLA